MRVLHPSPAVNRTYPAGVARPHAAAPGWRPLAGIRLRSVWWDACERLAECAVPVLCLSIAGIVALAAGEAALSTTSAPAVPALSAYALALAIRLGVSDAQLRAAFGGQPRRFGRVAAVLALHTLCHAALLCAPLLVIDGWVRAAGPDRAVSRRVPATLNAMLRASLLRTFGQMTAMSGSALGELAPGARESLAGVMSGAAAATYDFDTALASDERVSFGAGVGRVETAGPRASAALLWMVAGAYAVIAIVDAALRLHALAVARAVGGGLSVRAGMLLGARLAARGFGAAAAHGVATRLVCFMAVLVFACWPQVYVEAAAQPRHVVRMLSEYGLGYAGASMCGLAWCALNALWQAFGAICDVRIYVEVAAGETGGDV